MASDGIIKTEHSARLRLIHGEDCEGCQDIGLAMALHIVALAGWRIVRTAGYLPGTPNGWAIEEEWTPDHTTTDAAGVAAELNEEIDG